MPARGAATPSPRGPNNAGATPTRLERGRLQCAPDPTHNWNPAS